MRRRKMQERRLNIYTYIETAPPQLRLVPLQTAGSVEGVQLHGHLCAQRHVGCGDGAGMRNLNLYVDTYLR